MRYGSVCSGIESASVAWGPMGWSAAWFSEVEAFPSAVLAHHWPDVANLGDMTQLPELLRMGLIEAPDMLVGGTPCQAFSVAGMRKGLEDERGQLTIKYVEVANEIDRARPIGSECIAVWENVPGVLSSKDNAFGCFLGALVGEDDPLEPAGKKWTNAGIVYGPQRVAAWRILDAQYFGVAQRRRRVFVVASARKGFDPAAVLFESESLRRDTPPSREEGPPVAALTANGVGTCGADDNQGQARHLIAMAHGQGGAEVREDGQSPTLTCNHESPIVCHGSQDPCVSDKAFALGRNGGQENVVCFAENSRAEVRLEGADGQRTGALSTGGGKAGQGVPMIAQGVTIHGTDKTVKVASYTDIAGSLRTKPPGSIENSSTTAVLQVAAFSAGQSKGAGSIAYQEEQSPTLRGGASGTNQVPTLHSGTTVRRLMPRECERLQGFPDDHTLIDWRSRASKKKIEADVLKYFIRSGFDLEAAEAAARHPDGPRYKAIGNSKAVPVIRWVGERIKKHLEATP